MEAYSKFQKVSPQLSWKGADIYGIRVGAENFKQLFMNSRQREKETLDLLVDF